MDAFAGNFRKTRPVLISTGASFPEVSVRPRMPAAIVLALLCFGTPSGLSAETVFTSRPGARPCLAVTGMPDMFLINAGWDLPGGRELEADADCLDIAGGSGEVLLHHVASPRIEWQAPSGDIVMKAWFSEDLTVAVSWPAAPGETRIMADPFGDLRVEARGLRAADATFASDGIDLFVLPPGVEFRTRRAGRFLRIEIGQSRTRRVFVFDDRSVSMNTLLGSVAPAPGER